MSLPTRERGLKFAFFGKFAAITQSLPTRERGLKFLKSRPAGEPSAVAPYAGAWIEIRFLCRVFPLHPRSLPTRERGLKLSLVLIMYGVFSRSLRGSVD